MCKLSKLVQVSVIAFGAALIAVTAYSGNTSVCLAANDEFETVGSTLLVGGIDREFLANEDEFYESMHEQLDAAQKKYQEKLKKRNARIVKRIDKFSEWSKSKRYLVLDKTHVFNSGNEVHAMSTVTNTIDNETGDAYLSEVNLGYSLELWYNMWERSLFANITKDGNSSGWEDSTLSESLQLKHFLQNRILYNKVPDTLSKVKECVEDANELKQKDDAEQLTLSYVGIDCDELGRCTFGEPDAINLDISLTKDTFTVTIDIDYPDGSVDSETYLYVFRIEDSTSMNRPVELESITEDTSRLEELYSSLGGE